MAPSSAVLRAAGAHSDVAVGEPAPFSDQRELLTAVISRPFFSDMDLRKLKLHQVAFLGQAIGGPMRYNGAGMQRAHAHLRIEQRHFDAVAQHLAGTLQEFALPDIVIGDIMKCLAPLAPQIVNTPSAKAAGAD